MAYMKPGSPWLYDEATGDIVGVKDADGQDSFFARTNLAGTAILNPNGVEVPLPASQSLLSVTTIKLAANTVVASAGYIPFDTVVRDDLGLFISSAQGIKVPADATQLCFSWDIGYLASTDGTYRKITPRIYIGNIVVTNANIGILAHIMLSSNIAQSLGHAFSSHKIDVASMLAAQSLAFAGDQTDRFTLQLGHDATVGSLQIVAGSSMTLEAYTPA